MEMEPTIVPSKDFDKDRDVNILRRAMKGLGTDEKAIIDIVVERSNAQRLEIVAYYKVAFGKDLIKDLKSELSRNFEYAVLALMQPFAEFDAACLKESTKGAGTKESTLVEILCARNNAQIKAIKDAYTNAGFGDLEKNVQGDTSGDLKYLLTGLIMGRRDESEDVDHEKVEEDAKAIFEAGEGSTGTDESVFQRVMVTRSWPHLRAVFTKYEEISGKTLEETIRSEMSGTMQDAYLNLISYGRNRVEYFADVLHSAMKGMGTNEKRLIRTLVTRSEIDLGSIKTAYQKKYEQSLRDAVSKEVSGDLKRLLLALIGR